MKWTVQRYVLREVVQTWLAVTGVLVAILVSNQLSRVLGQAADNQYGRGVVFDLIALGTVMYLSVIVPVGLLLAMVLTLGRMYHDSEMAALQACGFGPSRLLAPLFCFAAVIAVGLGWLAFEQVPRADSQVQLLRQSALKEAEFGQLDAGRFRAFSGGDAVFYAERVDQEGVLHNVFVQRENAGRIEVALAETATYSKASSDSMHLVTLFNGRRYEGVPGQDDFRVIEFREHGIPISTPQDIRSSSDPDTKPTRLLWGSSDPSDIAQLQFRASTPLMALVLTLVAVPLSKLRPRQGRYTQVGFALVVYYIYSNLLSASKIWVEKGDLPPAIGVWWVHAAALALGLYLVMRDARKA
ncbi:MAG: lipopolysaccharide export system permease protein [Gammaproteobacteria bacterium]|jgi:lipopolysaccharide export system permease protein|nr:lipopolysaccharide export system permease protein [Gammaproteobacteria bacterium]